MHNYTMAVGGWHQLDSVLRLWQR